jgi:integrase
VTLLPDGRAVLEIYARDAAGIRRRSRFRFPSERAAQKAEVSALKRAENGLSPFAGPEAAPSLVKDALSQYHSAHVPDTRPNSQKRMKDHRRELEAVLGDIEVERLTYDALLRYRRERREDYKRRTKRTLSDVTVKKELSHLRASFRYAKINDKIQFHVFEKLSRDMRSNLFPSEERGAGQVIEDDAFEAIVAVLLPAYRPAVRFLRASGMRKGEVCGLRWADVRRDRIALTDEPGNKTGAREIPLTDEMRALFPPRKLDASALVFEAPEGGSAYHGLGQAWDEARRKAKHPTLRLHDLRHTVATELDEYGDRTAMKAALGMSDATVGRYAEHRRFDRAAALFAKNETRHKRVTTASQSVADES